MDLVDQVRQDVIKFLKGQKDLLFNERDFQMHLALILRESNEYDDVDLEYYIPSKDLKYEDAEREENEKALLGNDLRIDIVVKKGEEYCPIELKYKTKEHKASITRFGEELSDVTVMKNQGARDLGMYSFWRDVRRVELIQNTFKKTVKNGLVVFLTNDEAYTKSVIKEFNYKNFSMSEGEHEEDRSWKNGTKLAVKYVNFKVNKKYSIDEWYKITIKDENFYFCVLKV